MQFGQDADIQQGFARSLASTHCKLFGRRAGMLYLLGLLLFALGKAPLAAEPRRCLRDGKVVITNVPCELLGNATELNPAPEKHFKRGERGSRFRPKRNAMASSPSVPTTRSTPT